MSKSCPVLSPIPNFPVLVPQAIDHRASQDPDRIIFTYPNPSTKQLVDVSWKEFAHQVNIGAWSIDKLIGSRRSSSDPVKVIGVLARSDAAYMVTIYALHKCGITPLLLSIRNSRAATSNLLKLTGSVAILADSYHRGEAEASSIEVGSIPVFDMAPLPGRVTEERESFPFLLRWDDECDKPAVILHTSGSTGLPKPVAWSTRFIWHQTYYPAPYVAKYIGSSMLCTLPIFHGSGLSLIRASMLWLGWKIILPDSSKPVTASSIIDICINPSTAPDIVAGAPSVIQDITSIPGGWEIMRHTKTWFFVGAPVPPHFGDELVERGVHITPNLGSTETGQMSVLEPEMRSPADWNYHEMRPDLDIILQSRGRSVESGPFELIILEKDGWKPGVVNINVNGIDGYATSDLYMRHPSHSTLLQHVGRADDVVVLANGEKTLSRTIEITIEANLYVQNAIVFGAGRVQNGVLIVPLDDCAFDPSDRHKLREFRNTIWPSVQQANLESPAHSQIWKQMILIASPDKPLPCTDKGTVKRKSALDLYEHEISDLYRTSHEESLSTAKQIPLPTILNVSSLVICFGSLIRGVTGKHLGADDNVFEHGVDSLSAISIRNALLTALRGDTRTSPFISNLPQNFIFSHATGRMMGEGILRLMEISSPFENDQQEVLVHAAMIEDMVQKYASEFPVDVTDEHYIKPIYKKDGEVIVLTGSTGSLGTYLLQTLIADPSVTQVYAFNRPGPVSSIERQRRSYTERHLDIVTLNDAVLSGRLTFVDVLIHLQNLGLSPDVYHSIQTSSSLIIHNAWAVNFNWTLDAFEPVHIKGLRNIIDFAISSPRPQRIAFTSSISTVGAYTSGSVPEVPLDDPAVCMTHGYARSKFVAERILSQTAEKTGLETLVFRIGQISGDSNHGIWHASDSVPALLKGSQELGVIPSDWPSFVAWVPVDIVAQTIADVCLGNQQPSGTFHIANPTPTPWHTLLPFIRENLGGRDSPQVHPVKMREWVDLLRSTHDPPELNPAIKLTAFFEDAMNGKGVRCNLEVERTKEISAALRMAPPIDERHLKLYLDHWKSIKFLRDI